MKPRISFVVTDLDNTLFDWVAVWHASFKAMLDELAKQSGVSIETLKADFKAIHQKYGTSEYAFAIEELSSLREKHGDAANLVEIYKPAIEAYRGARRATLAPYPDVIESLEILKDKGCVIAGYTESKAFYTSYRMRRLGLDRILDILYSPSDHALPSEAKPERFYSPDHYVLRRTIHKMTPDGELKPNPKLLLNILFDCAAKPEESIYIGDSLMKDVAMAQDAKVLDVWAEYGAAQHKVEYELLREVTHWTSEDVEREKAIIARPPVAPKYILNNFKELFDHFEFVPFERPSPQNIQQVVDAWKMTVDVQKHFNDLELRIRNYAITLLTTILGVSALTLKDHVSVDVFSFHTSLASVLIVCGVVTWLVFYLMDQHWYHNLLIGSVNHGRMIEDKHYHILPELSLTRAISKHSATNLWFWRLHSKHKMSIFYFGVAIGLLLLAFFLHLSTPPKEAAKDSILGSGPATRVSSTNALLPSNPTPNPIILPGSTNKPN